ncbi:MAG: thiamine pyrophosphate-dependent dehydrogenase E1 component subunit alpha [Hyphomicrobiaceae bacterium]|nr:thiamine pyrophosphate-dependent dehydrogenase E1 component subunit alpha [Hyphomicrobiaceae bacterium]
MSLANFDIERGMARLDMMERIRAFEQAARRAAVEDELVLGAIHLSIGQEAVAAGVIETLRRDDYITSTHRGHGHTLAKGADPAAMMKELLGRAGGCCGGKGGSMHIADFGVNMLGANGVVSANITIAAGAAHGVKLLGGDQVTVCFFGDGAINRGPFLEGINWAGVFDLPILFVCEDNRYSASTLTSAMTSGDGAAARAQSLGLPATTVDGNDVTTVADTAAEIVARIRASQKPEFLHAKTYRVAGHTYFDPAAYRPRGEAEHEAATNCPINRQRAALAAAGVTIAEMDGIAKRAAAEMQTALDAAKAAPWPSDDTVFHDVQDIGSPATEAF